MSRSYVASMLLLCVVFGSQVTHAQQASVTHEQILKESISAMQAMNTALSLVRDEDTADAQKDKISKIAGTMSALQRKRRQLGEPTEEQRQSLSKSAEQVKSEAQKMISHLIRIHENRYAGRVIDDALSVADATPDD